WLNNGERAYLYDCLMQFMRFTGGALALLLTPVLVMVMREGRGATGVTFLPTGVFLISTAAALINLVRRLRPPSRPSTAARPRRSGGDPVPRRPARAGPRCFPQTLAAPCGRDTAASQFCIACAEAQKWSS